MCTRDPSRQVVKLETGFKLYSHGVHRKRNGVSVILNEDNAKNFVEVKRVFDRVIKMKLEIKDLKMPHRLAVRWKRKKF